MRRNAFLGRTAGLFGGIGIGAGVMYLLDPQQGRRRRALIRDKFVRAGHVGQREAVKQVKNGWNHVYGSVAELRSKITDRTVDDDVLVDRVRAQIGHVVSHPGSLSVNCNDGFVIVSGPVLHGERRKIENRLRQTRGVRGFDLSIEEHDSSSGIPGLQGESRWQRQVNVV